MKSRHLFLLLPLVVTSTAALGAPKKKSLSNAAITFSGDALEPRWTYRAQIDASKTGGATWIFGRDARNCVRLELDNRIHDKYAVFASLARVQNGKTFAATPFSLPMRAGELGLIRVGHTLKVLWNGQQKAQIEADFGGTQFGTRTSSAWRISNAQMQPTEAVVFRDDFMRADGPDSPEVPDEWKVAGVWKTSGTLGPRADSALSPNPFVFRASGSGTHLARAGKWFWNDYSVSASVRAVADEGDSSPLVVALNAFSDRNGGVRGEVDFRTGIARIVQTSASGLSATGLRSVAGKTLTASSIKSERVLASSAPFDASIGEWHRMRLEPKNGIVRLLFDGIEVARAKCDLAQGEVALRAQTGAANFVDFDDVRVGEAGSGDKTWGEGDLPARLVKDRLMRNWANAATAWKRDGHGVWWHTGDFWGDANLEVPLPSLAKNGDGFRFYIGANPQNPPSAALVASVARRGGKIEARLNGQIKTLAAPANTQNTLRLALRSSAKGNQDVLSWNGQTLFSVPANSRAGTKIGIEPTRNALPLPLPPLQKLSIRANTFDRDGHSVIGVNITPVSPQIAKELGLPDATGAVVDNVEDGSPAQIAGFQNGDVVRAANGARVLDVETMRLAVGGVRAPGQVAVEILRAPADGSGLDWAACRAATNNQLDYAFTSAPVDWKPARGSWEVAERWTCSPQWSFFAGQHDEFPLLWSRFAMRGDWTLEAYLATPMDLTRGDRSPMDLNISVGDGKSVSSGYSFSFGAQNRDKNLMWRGNQIAVSNAFEMPAGTGEVHQDWFYVRLERRQTLRGVRFKWSVNGKTIGEYEDLNALKNANRLAFWTKNGALSIARVRLWHDGLLPLAPEARRMQTVKAPFPNALGAFAPRGTGRAASAILATTKQGTANVLEVENPRDGGDWTLYATRKPLGVSAKNRVLGFAYRATPDVKVNLYALVAKQWREIAWTGGAAKPEDNQPSLGQIEGVQTDDKWHTARFDLSAALQRSGLSGNQVEALAFAAPSRDYVRQGLGGNAQGARYWLRDLEVSG